MSYEQTNQDLLYIEDGYLTPDGYYVYIALAQVAIGPYIEDLYIDAGYYEDYSAVISLTCAADVISGEVVEASGTWTAAFTQSATVIRIQNAESTQTSAFTQTSSVGRILQASAAFTGAFSPTLTADAFKNHTAILNVLASIVTTPVVNRAANITLATIGNLNSQAVKTVDIVSTQTTATTQTTNGVKSTDITQNLSSTSTVSVDAFNVQFGQAAFSTTATIFASRNFGTGRPRSFTTTGTTSFTTNSKFGSHALLCNSGGSNNVQASATPDYNRWRTIDLWYYTTAPGGGGGFRLLSTSRWTLRVDNSGSPGLYTIVFNRPAGGNAETNNLTATGWVHLRLIREDSGSYYTLYINGAKQTWATNTFTTSALTATNETLVIGNTATVNQNDSIIDELLITNNLLNTSASSTITVPTAAWTFDSQTNVLILSHFNNVNDDDVSINQIGAAALTSTASLTAQANANTKQGAGAFAATATVTASVTRIKQFTSSLNSVFTVPDVKAKHQANGIASLEQAIFTQTTEGQRVRYFDITVSSLFTPTMTVNAQRAGVALLESNFVQSTQPVKTTDAISALSVISTQSVTAAVTAGFSSGQSTAFTQTTDNQRVRTADSTQSAQTTLNIVYTVLEPFGSNITAAFTQDITEQRVRFVSVAMTATVTQSTIAVKTARATSSPAANSTQTTLGTRIRFADIAQSSNFTQTVSAVKTTDISSAQAAIVSQSTEAVKTVTVTAPLGALFTPSIDADITARPLVFLESSFAVSTIIGSIKQFDPRLLGIDNRAITDPGLATPNVPTGGHEPSLWLPGVTVSIWAKRDQVTSDYQTIWYIPSQGEGDLTFMLVGTQVVLRMDWDPDEPQAIWASAAPQDTDWHHYLLHFNRQNQNYQYLQLYIDGIDQGERSAYSVSNRIRPWFYRTTVLGTSGVKFGQHDVVGIAGDYPNEITADGLGSVAQIWVGKFNYTDDIPNPPTTFGRYQFSPNLFYNAGPINLGSTGQGQFQQLPSPWIYNTLSEPFIGFVTAVSPSDQGLLLDWAYAETNLTIRFLGIFLYDIDLFLVTQSQCQGAAVRGGIATVTVQALVTVAAGGGVFGAQAELNAAANLSMTVSKTVGYASTLSAQASVFCLPGFFELAQATLATTAELVCDFDNIPPTRGEAALLSQFTVTVDVQSFTDSITLMVSFGTLNCAVTVIPPIRTSANLSSAFTVTATVGAIEQFAVLTASAGTMTIAASKRVGVVASITALATETVTANKFHGIGLTVLQAQGFQLTVGDIINIDPYLTLIIPTETRQLRILPENRVITIASESRLLYINKRTQV